MPLGGDTRARYAELLKSTQQTQSRESVALRQRIEQLTSKLVRLQSAMGAATDEWERAAQGKDKEVRREMEIIYVVSPL